MRAFSVFLVLFIWPILGQAQHKYLVLFADKGTSFSIDKPEVFLSPRAILRRNKQNIAITPQDFPVNKAYLMALNQSGIKVLYSSKWLNGALIDISDDKLPAILKLPFVKGLEGGKLTSLKTTQASNATKEATLPILDGGLARNQLEMLGANAMYERGITGKGVLLAVLDSGFPNVDQIDVFKKLMASGRVRDTYDFVARKVDVYRNSHNHGTSVLSCIAADLEGKMRGTAPAADFLLYITEDAGSETKLEEVNWLMAAERADSLGVDIISSSLGYYDFDGTENDYQYGDIDGNTALVTRAADWAASKGILVVLSAGNEADNAWKYITPPADGDSVIAVGAVDADQKYANFSSIGPRADGRLKPDVAAKGVSTTVASSNNAITYSHGTSFAAPLISGLVAGLKEAFPDLTAMQIREVLLASGSQAEKPDNLLGYGVPYFERAFDAAYLKKLITATEEEHPEYKLLKVFPNPNNTSSLKVVVGKKGRKTGYEARLFDQLGRFVYNGHFEHSRFEIPLQENLQGLYFLNVKNKDFSATVKISIP